jgi:NitT/TauT family transport system substrate-binding protein
MRLLALAALAAMLAPLCAGAESIKVGSVPVGGSSTPYLAQAEGYFAAEGVPAELVSFDAAQPVAVAVVAGSIDFGITALTAGFYNLAAHGQLQIIAAAAHEYPGFHLQAYLTSAKADAAGLKSLKDLPGHAFAVTGIGGPPIYVVGALATAKYGFDIKSIRFVPVSTLSNIVTSLAGGQVDATLTSLTASMPPLIERGEVKLMVWSGDVTPWQYGAVFTSTKMARERPDTVERFLRAYRKATRDYHDAFTGPGESRRDGPTAPQVLELLAKSMNQPPEEIKASLPYFDADARLDVKDVLKQVAWYRAQGLVKGPVEGDAMIAARYVIPLPER